MILKNIISTCTVLAVLMVGTLGVFTWQLPEAGAQTNSVLSQACPINGSVWAEFQNTSFPHEVGDVFSDVIKITNDTDYAMSGVRVAVAAYKTAADTVPAYWTVLADSYQLLPNDNTQFPVELSLAALPAGEYVLKAFAMQGDETAVLGAAIRDVEKTNGLKLVKSLPKASDIKLSVTVNGKKSTGQVLSVSNHDAMTASIETTNGNSEPFFERQLLGVITQGEIPLGAAVREERSETVVLIPKASRSTEVVDNYVEGGVYTVYAGLIDPIALQPFMAVPIQVADTGSNGPWAYVSKIGLSDYPLQADSTAVACVEYTGVDLNINRFLEPLAVDFTLSSGGADIATKHVTSAETGTRDYFSFAPQVETNEFTLAVDFLQERFRGAMVENEDGTKTRPETLLSVVDTTTLSFTCPNSDVCVLIDAADIGLSDDSSSTQNSFWFYAGIVLAALLLMYIMLRRLDPQSTTYSSEANVDELQ